MTSEIAAKPSIANAKGPPMLGLALSGGGFRAAFFHVGTLARMAQLGLLQRVEAISTVSGGSIVGALYYLKLKKLLDETPQPDALDYCRIVKEVEVELFEVVSSKFRGRGLLSSRGLLRLPKLALRSFTRTDLLAELLDEYLYKPAFGQIPTMRDLQIPGGKPFLLIGATTLNTGHNWRFEPKVMGEGDPRRDPFRLRELTRTIDKNLLLKRCDSYEDLEDESLKRISLGRAVAASAAVPGLFPAITISGMYRDPELDIRLVDGGVHDNLGTEGLLHVGCKILVVSDASGQSRDRLSIRRNEISEVLRTKDVLMDRIREEQLFRLHEYAENETHAFAWMDLRRELEAGEARLKGTHEESQAVDAKRDEQKILSFGVDARVQDRLSRMRTDLNQFTDLEAYSLMHDAHLMSEQPLMELLPLVPNTGAETKGEALESPEVRTLLAQGGPEYLHQLERAEKTIGRRRKSLKETIRSDRV